MLDKTESVTLAKELVATGEIQSGLKRVKALGRPELAMDQLCWKTRSLDYSRTTNEPPLDGDCSNSEVTCPLCTCWMLCAGL